MARIPSSDCINWNIDHDGDGTTGLCSSPGSPHYQEIRGAEEDGCEFALPAEDLLDGIEDHHRSLQ